MLAIPLGTSSAEWYSLPHQNSYHFNTCFGDMCVDTVMHHHSIEVSFGLLESAGVPFYIEMLVYYLGTPDVPRASYEMALHQRCLGRVIVQRSK